MKTAAVFLLAFLLSAPSHAGETEIPIPRTAPDDPMQSFLLVTNGGKETVMIEIRALDDAGQTLQQWQWRIPGGETVTKMLKAQMSVADFARLAAVRVEHPNSATVQHVVGVAPPEHRGAFTVPA